MALHPPAVRAGITIMTKPPLPRPLSIKVIAILFISGAVLNSLEIVTRSTRGDLILGFFISGRVAVLYFTAITVLVLLTGIGLWRLNELARRVAIGWESYTLVNFLLTSIILDMRTKVVPAPLPEADSARVMFFVLIVLLPLFIIRYSLILYFLIKRKSAFSK